MDRAYNLDNNIILTPYSDRGCYNCYYYVIRQEGKLLDNYCKLYKCPICIWKWCKNWSKEHEI